MKLKNILEEQISERNLYKLEKNCSTFLELNKNKLLNGNVLFRGTKHYDRNVIKKDFRQRKGVGGDPLNTWVYEYFKPKNYPSRQEMVPTQNNNLSRFWSGREFMVFGVFPIGNSYELQFSDGVEDFNSSNPHFSGSMDIISLLYAIRSIPVAYDLSDHHVQRVHRLMDFYHDADDIHDYQELRSVYGTMWKELKEIASQSKDDDVLKKIGQIKESAKSYFNNSYLGQKIPSQSSQEVNVYAPDGFYYVKKDFISGVISKIFKNE